MFYQSWCIDVFNSYRYVLIHSIAGVEFCGRALWDTEVEDVFISMLCPCQFCPPNAATIHSSKTLPSWTVQRDGASMSKSTSFSSRERDVFTSGQCWASKSGFWMFLAQSILRSGIQNPVEASCRSYRNIIHNRNASGSTPPLAHRLPFQTWREVKKSKTMWSLRSPSCLLTNVLRYFATLHVLITVYCWHLWHIFWHFRDISRNGFPAVTYAIICPNIYVPRIWSAYILRVFLAFLVTSFLIYFPTFLVTSVWKIFQHQRVTRPVVRRGKEEAGDRRCCHLYGENTRKICWA